MATGRWVHAGAVPPQTLRAGILAAVHPGEVALKRTESGVVVVSLTGEHDLTTAAAVRECVDQALSQGAGVIFDLSGAGFIDSSIIGVVLDARRRADEAGVGFATALEDGAPAVRRVLDVTGLDTNLPVLGKVEEAVERAAGSGQEDQ
jgi:anti-sigma B factor antagonist